MGCRKGAVAGKTAGSRNAKKGRDSRHSRSEDGHRGSQKFRLEQNLQNLNLYTLPPVVRILVTSFFYSTIPFNEILRF